MTKSRSVSWGWKLPVMCALENGSHTFGELWAKMPGITPKVLSDTLHELEAHQLVAQGPAGNAEVQYALAPGGTAALPDIHNILRAIVNDAADYATPEQFLRLQGLFEEFTQHRPTSSAEAIRRAAEKIRRLIAMGALRPGERLPSAENIATMMALTLSQAQQVYDQLKAEGVVTTRRRKGTFVPSSNEQSLETASDSSRTATGNSS